MSRPFLTRTLLTLSLATLFAPWTVAQPDTDEKSRLAQRGIELTAKVTENRAEVLRLAAEAEAATGESESILRRRLAELSMDMLDDLGSVTQNTLKQEEAGLDTQAIRAQLEPLVLEIAESAPVFAREQLDRMRSMREEATTSPPDDLEVFEDRFNKESDWLDTVHRACLEHYERMVSLGLDAGALRAFLEETLLRGADSLAGRLEISAEEAASTRARLTAVPADETLQSRLRIAEVRMDGTARSLTENVAMLKRLDLPTTRYQQVLIQSTGDITTDVLDRKVAFGLFKGWIGDGGDWLLANGPNIVFRGIVLVLVLTLFWIFGRFARRIVRRSVVSSKLNLSKLLQDMIVSFAGKAVFAFGILLALSQVGVSLGPLLAGLGIVGFIVGFALQDTLANFAAGMMILVYRPFDVGDLVESATVFGRVHNMNLVSTTILTLDHQTLIVPNNKIWGDVIKNVTSQRQRRVDMTFGISYGCDIPKTERLLQEIVQAHPKVLQDPEPMIKLHNLGDSSVDFIVRPWVETDDYWDVKWDITREVKMRFDAEGISIPFPQRDVHLYQQSAEAPATADAT